MAYDPSIFTVDTSILVVVLTHEPGWQEWRLRLATANWIGIGAPTLLETHIVMGRKLMRDPRTGIESLLVIARIEIIPCTAEHLRVAQDAFLRFGNGRLPAALNYGDCRAYATARVAGRPLLYAGDNFARTDAAPA